MRQPPNPRNGSAVLPDGGPEMPVDTYNHLHNNPDAEQSKHDREGLSVREAAAFVGVSTRMMQTLVAANTVPSFKVRSRRIIRKAALVAWMQREEKRAGRGRGL